MGEPNERVFGFEKLDVYQRRVVVQIHDDVQVHLQNGFCIRIAWL